MTGRGRVHTKTADRAAPAVLDRAAVGANVLAAADAIAQHGPMKLAQLASLSGVPVGELVTITENCGWFSRAGGRLYLTAAGRAAVRRS